MYCAGAMDLSTQTKVNLAEPQAGCQRRVVEKRVEEVTCVSGDCVKARSCPFHTHTPEMVESLSPPNRQTDANACLRILSSRWNMPAVTKFK